MKAAGLESGYLTSFRKAAIRYATFRPHVGIISIIPGYALKAMAFGGILIILIFLFIAQNGNLLEVIPVMGMFTFAGMRLLPVLSAVYQSLTKIKAGKPALDILYRDMFEVTPETADRNEANVKSDNFPIKFSTFLVHKCKKMS